MFEQIYLTIIILIDDSMPECDIECMLLNMDSHYLEGRKGLG